VATAIIIICAAENILIPFSAPDTDVTTQKLVELLYLKM